MSEATVIRFPVERRRQSASLGVPIGQPVQGVGGSNYSFVSNSVVSAGAVTWSGMAGEPEVVVPSPPLAANGLPLDTADAEPWWARVPEVEWAKLGFFPAITAKQHRLLAVTVRELGAHLALIALAACGRRGPLSHRFDENVSGGSCRQCSRR